MTVLVSSSTPVSGQVVTGVLGFLVVAGMGVALFFLLRSMNKHLRKVMREPRWRDEANSQKPSGPEPGNPDPSDEDGGGGPQGQPKPGYSRNSSGQTT